MPIARTKRYLRDPARYPCGPLVHNQRFPPVTENAEQDPVGKWSVLRPGRGRRDLHGRQAAQHEQGHCGGRSGTRHRRQAPVASAKDRAANQVAAEVVPSTTKPVLHACTGSHVGGRCHRVHRRGLGVRQSPELARSRQPQPHGVCPGQCLPAWGSFRSMLKRGHKGIHHKMSPPASGPLHAGTCVFGKTDQRCVNSDPHVRVVWALNLRPCADPVAVRHGQCDKAGASPTCRLRPERTGTNKSGCLPWRHGHGTVLSKASRLAP